MSPFELVVLGFDRREISADYRDPTRFRDLLTVEFTLLVIQYCMGKLVSCSITVKIL